MSITQYEWQGQTYDAIELNVKTFEYEQKIEDVTIVYLKGIGEVNYGDLPLKAYSFEPAEFPDSKAASLSVLILALLILLFVNRIYARNRLNNRSIDHSL